MYYTADLLDLDSLFLLMHFTSTENRLKLMIWIDDLVRKILGKHRIIEVEMEKGNYSL